jgi:hypothetical protein
MSCEVIPFLNEAISERTDIPICFNIPIVDYFDEQVYCLGFFRLPNEEEIRTHSNLLYAMFVPAEAHGFKISLYSKEELEELISRAKPI